MRLPLIAILVSVLAACETPQTRIKRNQELFDSCPPHVQELIRSGEVEVGFTADQARMALGKPDRVIQETTAALAHEVWVYGAGGSRVRFGFAMGMFSGGRTAMGTGVGVGGAGPGDRLRLDFANGTLVKIWKRS
jgi:hypothetical protein